MINISYRGCSTGKRLVCQRMASTSACDHISLWVGYLLHTPHNVFSNKVTRAKRIHY